MNPCPQCGAIPQATDKFCNICGTPVAPPGYGAQPQGGFPPPNQGFAPPAAYGAPPAGGAPLRCQMGHEIAPGASYCPLGHPIALEAMPFANDQYGGYPQQQGGFGAPPPQQQGFGAPPPQQGFPGQGYDQGAPPGYAQPYPDPNMQYAGYGQPQPGYGQPQYGAPAAQPGFAPPPGFGTQAPGYGQPAPEPPGVQAPPNLPPNALRGFLVSYQANTQGDFWPLHGGRKTVGRANSGEQVDIPLADATISSRHAAIVVDGASGAVHVEDTGSTNGTFVNEEHIGFNGKRELRDGDKVRFGGFTTLVKVMTRI
jgi:hypothetical protein